MFAAADPTAGLLRYEQTLQLSRHISSCRDVVCSCCMQVVDFVLRLCALHSLGWMSAALYGASVVKAASWTALSLSDKSLNNTFVRYKAFEAAVALTGCFWLLLTRLNVVLSRA